MFALRFISQDITNITAFFNKNNVKVSYSCMDNMQSMIKKHNKKVASIDTKPNSQDQCNYRDKDQCPIDNNCLTSGVIYNARVTTDDTTKNYIGLTEGTFKQRFTQEPIQQHTTIQIHLATSRQQERL